MLIQVISHCCLSCFTLYQVSTLALCGGNNAGATVRRMLKSVFANSLASQFNWAGKGQKMAFKDTKIHDVLFGKLHACTKHKTEDNWTELNSHLDFCTEFYNHFKVVNKYIWLCSFWTHKTFIVMSKIAILSNLALQAVREKNWIFPYFIRA